jgi:hypothetical protein
MRMKGSPRVWKDPAGERMRRSGRFGSGMCCKRRHIITVFEISVPDFSCPTDSEGTNLAPVRNQYPGAQSMNRREFLTTSSIAGSVALAGSSMSEALAQETQREFYELRVYEMQTGNRKNVLNDYLAKAAIPAWNRLGIKPVGVFSVVSGSNALMLYVLIPYPSLEAFLTAPGKLGGRVPGNFDRQSRIYPVRHDVALGVQERTPATDTCRNGGKSSPAFRTAHL